MRRALGVAVLGVLLLGVAPAAADAGPWGWPLAGAREVSRAFDPPASRYGAGHRGVDLPSAPGAVVRASAAGRVSYAGLLAGRGVVVVTHGALRTTYEPVTASVRVGQAVALGEPVGALTSGHAGCAAAACLHWGLRRGEEYLDPVRLVERGPFRLLPVAAEGAAVPGAAAAAPARGAALVEPRRVSEPSWSLRSAEAPWGALAVVALVLGVALLARPRPDPDDPPEVPAAAGRGAVLPEPARPVVVHPDPDAQVLELAVERERRRPA